MRFHAFNTSMIFFSIWNSIAEEIYRFIIKKSICPFSLNNEHEHEHEHTHWNQLEIMKSLNICYNQKTKLNPSQMDGSLNFSKNWLMVSNNDQSSGLIAR